MNKIVAILGRIVGIFAVILGLFEPTLGWWDVTVDDYLVFFDGSGAINAFGYSSNTANDNIELLGPLLLIGGILFLVSSVLIIIASFKENKNFTILCSFLMIGGLALFCYGLTVVEDFENILEGLNFFAGEERTVFFGTVDLGLGGDWAWRLGNGFFIAIGGAVIALIGSFLKK